MSWLGDLFGGRGDKAQPSSTRLPPHIRINDAARDNIISSINRTLTEAKIPYTIIGIKGFEYTPEPGAKKPYDKETIVEYYDLEKSSSFYSPPQAVVSCNEGVDVLRSNGFYTHIGGPNEYRGPLGELLEACKKADGSPVITEDGLKDIVCKAYEEAHKAITDQTAARTAAPADKAKTSNPGASTSWTQSFARCFRERSGMHR
jgi:hypothetical protein